MIHGIYRRWPVQLVFLFLMAAIVTRGQAEAVINPRDTLVYKDGDRVQGKLVQRTADLIVFKSDRFGELRVPASDAVIIPADRTPGPAAQAASTVAAQPAAKPAPKPAVAPAKTASKAATAAAKPAPKQSPAAATHAAELSEAERVSIWDRFTPSVLTARVRKTFGPWKGRFAFSTEVVTDVAERDNHSFEARVNRKWEHDEVQLSSRYDYAETNNLPTTDMLKASAFWRHAYNKSVFVHYRPSGEWNRASKRRGVPNDYILLQQEVGIGYNLLNTPARKVRTGVSENFFNLWNTASTWEHSSRTVQSVFEEFEFKLPWQMGLTQRGVWYPVKNQTDGWEHRIELNKKLTETLSTSVRHEIRRDNPDGSAQDYTRLKLLFGLDF